VDDGLLTAVAGSENRYFFAPTPSQLDPIYRRLSESVGEVAATDVVVTDRLGPDMAYVQGSANPPAALSGDVLTWDLGALPPGGVELTLSVRPQVVGRLPTNRQAAADYTADGTRYRFTFPVPEVEVVALPTVTPTATPSPTPTATPTPHIRRIYLPLVMKRWCRPADAELGLDIVLAVDTSSSMTGEKLAAAVAASQAFLELVDPRRDHVGLVTFDSDGRREHRLTADLAAIAQQLDGLTTRIGTRIDLGLEESLTEFLFHGRPKSPRVIVLLSDGQPIPSSRQAALDLAGVARQLGVTTFTIGLGADADGDLLRQLATSPDNYFFAPGPVDLGDIYRRVAVQLPCR
jgi:uncharacterized protein YegL